METVLALITTYGALVLFGSTFLSCLALPVPASLMMLAGGGFVAAGDMTAIDVAAAAYGGAILGDLTGFAIARGLGARLAAWIDGRKARADLFRKANALTDRWGGVGIYLSRWLFSPLGPYVNLTAGLTRFRPLRFLAWDLAGEATWVAIYVGLGFAFADNIAAIADIASNASGLMAGAALTVGLGVILWRKTGKPAHDPHI